MLSANKIEMRTNGKKGNGASKCSTRRKGPKTQKRKGLGHKARACTFSFIQFHTVCKAGSDY